MEPVEHSCFPKKELCFALVHRTKRVVKGNFLFGVCYLEQKFCIIFSYDGYAFRNHADSQNGHYYTTLANIEGHPLAVGGYTGSAYIKKAETYNISTNTWTETADYPYHD